MLKTESSESEFVLRLRVAQATQFAGARIKDRDTGIARGDPQAAEPVARHRSYALQLRRATQLCRCSESAGLGVAEHHAAANGADPQTVFGGDQRGDPSVRQRFFVATFMTQLTELITIEAIESVFGAEPHEPFAVLDDGVHRLLRQAFLEAVALHAEWRSRGG
jgi:hypothetical protein